MQAAYTHDNKTLVRRLVDEVLNCGDLAAADALIAPDYVEHSPLPGQRPGLVGLKQALSLFRAAFPDFHLKIDDLIAEADRVVLRGTVTATHNGHFLGIPPTGRRVRWTAIDIVRIVGGRQVEHWGNQETLELLYQLSGSNLAQVGAQAPAR
jgi:predicted ester cyclase